MKFELSPKKMKDFLLFLLFTIMQADASMHSKRNTHVIDRNDVAFLADDEREGRAPFTRGWVQTQEYLIDQLMPIARGVSGSGDSRESYRQDFFYSFYSGRNILGLIQGSEIPDEYVIVGAHYDHLRSCDTVNSAESDVCNGATDNAVGVAAVLGIGRAIAALPTRPRRSVVLALWDREEVGLVGSSYYVDNPIFPLENTIAYLNFDIMGANMLPSMRNITVAIGAETGGPVLRDALDNAIDGEEELRVVKLTMAFGQGRSDHVNFEEAQVPVIFFTDATGGCYHTTGDELGVVDFIKAEKEARLVLNLVLELIESSTVPSFENSSVTINDYLTVARVLVRAVFADRSIVIPAIPGIISFVIQGIEDGYYDIAGALAIAIFVNIGCDGFLKD